MQQIVDALGSAYGYEVYKAYKQVFEPVDVRSMYYHFKRGVDLGEFKQIGAKQEKGGFTWGRESTHIYYALGESATHKSNSELRETLKKFGYNHRSDEQVKK
jgi:hypothetical protein